MSIVTIEEAQSSLADLIRRLAPGEEVLITDRDRTVARLLIPAATGPTAPRRLGTLRGTVRFVAPDFDAPLDDFAEYMG